MWQHGQNKFTLCNELVADFADLYRYNGELTSTKKKKGGNGPSARTLGAKGDESHHKKSQSPSG